MRREAFSQTNGMTEEDRKRMNEGSCDTRQMERLCERDQWSERSPAQCYRLKAKTQDETCNVTQAGAAHTVKQRDPSPASQTSQMWIHLCTHLCERKNVNINISPNFSTQENKVLGHVDAFSCIEKKSICVRLQRRPSAFPAIVRV